MAAKHINENFLHNCGLSKVKIKDKIKSITDMNFDNKQVIDILDFYLFHAPVLKSGKDADEFGLKSLKNYGWFGNSAINKLEGQLLKASSIAVFCFIKSDSIIHTLESMDLADEICIQHPRAVMKQNCSVSIQEDGTTIINQNETRMECLFRHIRNSFAHNHTYLFDNDNILLEDCDESGKISARILMPKNALIEWMDIIKKTNEKQESNTTGLKDDQKA